MKRLVLALLAAVAVGGIAGCSAERQATGRGTLVAPVSDPSQRFRLEGFTVLPPKGDNWYFVQEGPEMVAFSKDTGQGRDHTVVATAAAQRTANAVEGITDLLATVKRYVDKSDANFSGAHSKMSATRLAGQDCAKIDFSVEDRRQPSRTMTLTGYEIWCVRPTDRRALVVLAVSQRFLRGEKPLPLENEVQPFLDSLEFSPP